MKKFLPLLLLLAGLASNGFAQSTVVATQNGDVQGSINNGIYQFLGIPFAKPPVGNLRWKAPETPDAWNDTLLTNAFKPVCPQKNFSQTDTSISIKGDEDCLYLNVWSANPSSTANKPVMVFIHGGGNQQGGTSDSAAGTLLFFGKHLAERGDVVMVTIAYRLGPLGFLVHPGLEGENANHTSGNYAVMDQILALQWVKQNIKAFGGDTSRVMIFGESAGGVDVGNLMITPLAAGLFSRACIESASPVVSVYSASKTAGVNFVNGYVGTGTDSAKIQYMRTLPADSLVKNETSPLAGGIAQGTWGATQDDIYFTQQPKQAFESGNFNHVPFMIGSNADEMALASPPVVTPSMVTALFNAKVPQAYVNQGLALYPPGSTNAQARTSYVQALTDAQFTAPARRTARTVNDHQTEPVWRYFFTHHQGGQLAAYGAYHGIELSFVFNTLEDSPFAFPPYFTVQDDSVEYNMLHYWANFAKTGNPNDSTLVTWPLYNSIHDCYLEIKPTPNGSQCGLRTDLSDYWDMASYQVYVPDSTDDTTGIGPIGSVRNINLYPNPTNGQFTVANASDNTVLMVYDFEGRLCLKKTINAGQQLVDLNREPNGVYLIVLQTSTGIYTGKVLKQ